MKTPTENYKTLIAGDVRQLGDQWRAKPFRKMQLAHGKDITDNEPWREVKHLLDAVILASDLIHLEFRRPV